MTERRDRDTNRPPVEGSKPGALDYTVTPFERPRTVLHGPCSVDEAHRFAREHSRHRGTQLDVVINGTTVLLTYGSDGRPMWG